MLATILFYLTCATLLSHELDAVHKHEWRLLFVLRGLRDEAARSIFVVAHVPLLAILFWLAADFSGLYVGSFEFWLDAFAVVHAGLHWRMSDHPKYEFRNPMSRSLIYGAAGLGAAHLVLLVDHALTNFFPI